VVLPYVLQLWWCALSVIGREVWRAHGGVASGWHAWCSGDLGDG
jgi:hypothetical protein